MSDVVSLAEAARRAKIGAALQGWSISAARRAKISATLKGRSLSPERRVKISAALTGRLFSPTHRANLSAAHTRHGHAKGRMSDTYRSWKAMIARCRLPRCTSRPVRGLGVPATTSLTIVAGPREPNNDETERRRPNQ